MDKGLEKIIEVFKETFHPDENSLKIIEKQVSYLEYAFYDILESYKDEKISMDSLIIFFGYFFGMLIEDDSQLETLLAVIESVYVANKIKKHKL
jgi:hypothetical protein